jgi:hypothetical protein
MTTATYRFRAYYLGAVDARLAKINKKAKKLEMAGVTYRELRRYREWACYDYEGFQVTPWSEDEPADNKYIVQSRNMVEIELTGEPVKLGGWTFVAQVEHTKAGNTVRRMDGDDSPLDTKWRTAKSGCDHCKTNRFRKLTYLVRHEDGRQLQVGSTCVADFLRGHDPDKAIWLATAIRKLGGWLDEDSLSSASSGKYLDPAEYLTFVAQAIREFGWTSRGKARHEGRSTADDALQLLIDGGIKGNRGEPAEPPTDEDCTKAAAALAWVRDEASAVDVAKRSDYIHNLCVACEKPYITYKDLGLVASVVSAHTRELGRREKEKAERKNGAASKWIGDKGERLRGLEVTLTRTWSTDGYYGPRVMNQFTDSNGNVLVWWTNREAADQGDKVVLTGTVKKHDEYKGTKQTMLTRCAVA